MFNGPTISAVRIFEISNWIE